MAEVLGLMGRALDIVRLLLDGSDEQAAARTLGISRATVHTHLQRIYNRLGVHCRCDLALRVLTLILSCRPPLGAPAEKPKKIRKKKTRF